MNTSLPSRADDPHEHPAAGAAALIPRPRPAHPADTTPTLDPGPGRPAPAANLDHTRDTSDPRGPNPRGPNRRETDPGALRADGLTTDLARVAVWTAEHGQWQEHAWFVLHYTNGHRRAVAFTDPLATTLVPQLRQLPGFNPTRLLELLAERAHRIITIWTLPPDSHRT